MKVLLIRHGEAVDPSVASELQRYLTARGRRVTAQVGACLRERGTVPTHIYTSPLVRAVQTAEILAHTLGHPGPIVPYEHLVPGATTARAVAVLESHAPDDRVALVSHEPTVHRVAGHLSGHGGAFPGFRTSGVALLEIDGERGSLLGRLDPEGLRWRGPEDLGP